MSHLGATPKFPALLRLFRPRIECPHWDVLHKIRIFQTLTRRELGIVELILHERVYQGDEIVFEEEEIGLGMYIVLEGEVRIVRRGILRQVTGRRELLTVKPGEGFGEIALLNGVRRSAAAVAKGPTRLLSLFQTELLGLLETHHGIGFKVSYELASVLAERLRGSIEGDPTAESI